MRREREHHSAVKFHIPYPMVESCSMGFEESCSMGFELHCVHFSYDPTPFSPLLLEPIVIQALYARRRKRAKKNEKFKLAVSILENNDAHLFHFVKVF